MLLGTALSVAAANYNMLHAGQWSGSYGKEEVFGVGDTVVTDGDTVVLDGDTIAIVEPENRYVTDAESMYQQSASQFEYEPRLGGKFLFSINPDGYTVTLEKGHARKTEVLTIPETAYGPDGSYDVTAIANFAFSGNAEDNPDGVAPMEGVKKLIIPESVSLVGQNCFENAPDLEEVVLPSRLLNIGNRMFAGCENLKRVRVPENSQMVLIGSSAFVDCFALKSFYIPASVREIQLSPWRNCRSLEALTISDGNYNFNVYEGVLYGDEDTRLIQYPTGKKDKEYFVLFGTKVIDISAFYGNEYIEKVTFPASLTKIRNLAFFDCKNLKEVIFNYDWPDLGDKAFRSCPNLRTIQLYGNPMYTFDESEPAFNTFDSTTVVNINEELPNPELAGSDGTLFERVLLTVSSLPGFTTMDLPKVEDYGFPKFMGKARMVAYGNAAPKPDVLRILNLIPEKYKAAEYVDERLRIFSCYADYDSNQALYFIGSEGSGDLIVVLFEGVDTSRLDEFIKEFVYPED